MDLVCISISKIPCRILHLVVHSHCHGLRHLKALAVPLPVVVPVLVAPHHLAAVVAVTKKLSIVNKPDVYVKFKYAHTYQHYTT